MINFKGQKGITLIALVITIIVLLILAGITIAQITGQDSAPEKATEAKRKNDEGAEFDAIKVAVVGAVANGNNGLVDAESLKNELNGLVEDEGRLAIRSDNAPWTVVGKSGKVYEITSNATVNELSGLVLSPRSLSLTIENDIYEEKTLTASLIDIEGTLTWSNSTEIIDITPSQDGKSATIKAKAEGTETVTVTCSNGDIAECTVTVTENKPLAADTLLIKNNFSPYVKYTDPNGNVITCRVLYNDDTHGLQIISNDIVGNLECGYQDPLYKNEEDATLLTIAQKSYDNVIENLNNEVENYKNINLAYDVRCVGSVANIDNNEFINKNFENIGEDNHKSGDTNYEEDLSQLETLNIKSIGWYRTYWLASRITYQNGAYYCYSVRLIVQNGDDYCSLGSENFWYWYYTYYASATTNIYRKGLRPVFLIKSNVKVKSGDGLTENTAYVLQAGN